VTGEDYEGGIHSDTLLKENYINVFYLEIGFNQDTTYGGRPLSVHFADTCYYTNTQIERQWDFENDGIIDSEEENSIWTYDVPGSYSVKLIITDSCGSTNDTIIKEGLISVYGVLANFFADPIVGKPPLQVNFNDTSYTYLTEITQWQWDFENDGIIDSDEINPMWIYEDTGQYTVMLIVSGYTNNEMVSDTLLKENYITVSNLNADFIVSEEYGHYPLTIDFIDQSEYSPYPIGNIYTWQWDFENDGVIDSYEQNPVWIYEEPGIYSVKLVVKDTVIGVIDSIVKENLITVCNLSPAFYAEPLIGIYSLEVDFVDTSIIINSQIGTWKWDFQHDGIIDSWEQYPVWNYYEPGIYSVELIITDTSGQIWKSCVKDDYIEILTTGIEDETELMIDPLMLRPNPFKKEIEIIYNTEYPDIVSVQILDNSYCVFAEITTDEPILPGEKIWFWNETANLKEGLFYILLTTQTGSYHIEKCIKIN
jgi:PKD repeat protein